jgi:hypothetical protein
MPGLDGGGVHGLSALMILEQLMEAVFDMSDRTSTGG